MPSPREAAPELPLKIPLDVHRRILALRLDMHRLLSLKLFSTSEQFRRCVSLLDDIESELRTSAPGRGKTLVEVFKSRGTVGECTEFAVDLGLLPNDGEWFYYKMIGCGWKNGREPVKDWRAVMRAWKLAGYMASQRQGMNRNPTVHQRTIMEREVDQ